MKTSWVMALLAMGALGVGAGLAAQQSISTRLGADAGTSDPIDEMLDQGQREGFTVKWLTGAPFSASVQTELTRVLPDGSTVLLKSRTTLARDSTGRIFEEERTLAGDKGESAVSSLRYIDAQRNEFYNCVAKQKTCYEQRNRTMVDGKEVVPSSVKGLVASNGNTPRKEPAPVSIPLANGKPAARRASAPPMSDESVALGERTINGLEVAGSREAWPSSQITTEYWYSPRLGVDVVKKRFNRNSQTQGPHWQTETTTLENISLSEPNPRLFELPAGYQLVQQAPPLPSVARNGR